MIAGIEREVAWAMPVGLASVASGGRYEVPPHLKLLNEKLLEVADGRCKRLMIAMPPRHGKSETASKFFPAWFLGRYPDKRIILCSYEADFAASWGRKARNILEEWGPEAFGVKVAQDSSAANRWDIEGRLGGMVTAGVGGPITGKGADVLIIDDPVKNAEDAESATMREKTWDWYRSTAYTRLEPGGVVILIMTRWHEDDLAGRLLVEEMNGGDRWEKVIFPAEAEEDDALGRAPGAPLWPGRFSLTRLKEIAKTLGSYLYAALFQQRPQPAGGAIFRRAWFRYFRREGNHYLLRRDHEVKRVPVDACWRLQTVDASGTAKETSDFFVVMTFAVTPDHELLVLSVRRERAETTNQDRILDDELARWSPSYQGIEAKTFGLNLYQARVRRGIPTKELKADRDKVTRARPVAAMMEAEQVFFDEDMEGLGDLEAELLAFPRGAHDDMVDTLAYGGLEAEEEQGPMMWEL